MSKIILEIFQYTAGISALVILLKSFVELNNCNKDTQLIHRVSLIILLGASVGVLLLIISCQVKLHWPVVMLLDGVALYFINYADVRKYFKDHVCSVTKILR